MTFVVFGWAPYRLHLFFQCFLICSFLPVSILQERCCNSNNFPESLCKLCSSVLGPRPLVEQRVQMLVTGEFSASSLRDNRTGESFFDFLFSPSWLVYKVTGQVQCFALYKVLGVRLESQQCLGQSALLANRKLSKTVTASRRND